MSEIAHVLSQFSKTFMPGVSITPCPSGCRCGVFGVSSNHEMTAAKCTPQ